MRSAKLTAGQSPIALRALVYIWTDPTWMEHAQALALYASFAGDRLTFLYSGSFHDEHTARLIALGDEFLEHHGAVKGLRGKLAFVMVEAYQNIVRHRAPLPAELRDGQGRSMFVLRSTDTSHEVTAMNPVTGTDATRLRKELEHLGRLDLQQMKQVFLRGLQSDERTDRGGAGLGLIEMARRSGNPLRHALIPLDGDHQLFSLQVSLGPSNDRRSDHGTMSRVHDAIAAEGITLAFRGALPAAMQENLMRMVEGDLLDDPASAERSKHAFLLLMGAVTDLDVLSDGPMICVASHKSGSTLTVVLPLSERTAERVEHAVNAVNGLDAPTLQRRYRDALLGRGEGASGLEVCLMDLLRRSLGKIRISRDRGNGSPFVVLGVDV